MGLNKMKKAQAVFSLIMLFAFLYLLFTAIVRMNDVASNTLTVGNLELELKRVYLEAEKSLFYIEQAGRYSTYSIIDDIKENLSMCNESYPQKISKLLNEKIGNYILDYKGIIFPGDGYYDVILIDNGMTLIANAKSKLIVEFSKGRHLIDPSFSIPFGGGLNSFCN